MTKAEQIKALYRSNFSAFLKFAFRELNPKTDWSTPGTSTCWPTIWSGLPKARSRG